MAMTEWKKPKVLPPVYLLATIAVMVLCHLYLPIREIPGQYTGVIGILLVIGGVMIILEAGRLFDHAQTGVIPFSEATTLVTKGGFRFSRNPMYLGMVFILLGLGMKAGSFGCLLPVPFFIFFIHKHFVLPEEQFMEESFGEDYLAYKAKVRRWI